MSKPVLKGYLVSYNILSALAWSWLLVATLVHIFNIDGLSDVNYPNPNAKTATSVLFSYLRPSLGSRSTYTYTSYLSSLLFKSNSVESYLPPQLLPVFERAKTTFLRVGPQTAIIQSFAALEVIHVLLGFVRSPLATTVMQVSSRLMLVWGIAEQFPESRTNPLYTSMVLAWSATEVIRYSFYASNLLGFNPYFLLWLRYTTFYVLYPLGAGSEAFLMLSTLPKSSPVPGWATWLKGGIWHPLDYVRAGLFVIWWPGLYVMYTHMIAQRRKTLGKPKVKTVKTN